MKKSTQRSVKSPLKKEIDKFLKQLADTNFITSLNANNTLLEIGYSLLRFLIIEPASAGHCPAHSYYRS